MISNELLEEVINISSKEKYIDKKILQRVFDEVFVDLDDYTKSKFNGLEFAPIFDEVDTLAICNPEEGTIQFDLFECYKEENKNKNLNMLKRNLNIINNLLHEIEHLKQPYKLTKNNFESKILKCSIMTNNSSYDNLYNFIPAEKIASANSWKVLLKNLLCYPAFKEKFFDEYKFIINEYINNLKMGYFYNEKSEKYNVPLFYYLSKTNQMDVLLELGSWVKKNKEKNIDKISINDKLKYGLPITKQDMRIVNKQKIKAKSIK